MIIDGAAEDRHDEVATNARFRERWYLLILALAVGANVIQSSGLVKEFAKRQFVPVLITVDKQTGLVNYVRELSGSNLELQEAIDRHFVATYVSKRETWDATDIRESYQYVRLTSSQTVANEHESYVSAGNINGPANIYGYKIIREIEIKNITFLIDNYPRSAQVRFRATEKVAEGHSANIRKPVLAVATLTFEYDQSAMDDESRLANFAGFKVTRYRLDEDYLQ